MSTSSMPPVESCFSELKTTKRYRQVVCRVSGSRRVDDRRRRVDLRRRAGLQQLAEEHAFKMSAHVPLFLSFLSGVHDRLDCFHGVGLSRELKSSGLRKVSGYFPAGYDEPRKSKPSALWRCSHSFLELIFIRSNRRNL